MKATIITVLATLLSLIASSAQANHPRNHRHPRHHQPNIVVVQPTQPGRCGTQPYQYYNQRQRCNRHNEIQTQQLIRMAYADGFVTRYEDMVIRESQICNRSCHR